MGDSRARTGDSRARTGDSRRRFSDSSTAERRPRRDGAGPRDGRPHRGGREERNARPSRELKKKSFKGPWKKTAYSVSTPKTPYNPDQPAPVVNSALDPATIAAHAASGERLQKIIANAGICSRREAERLILEGAVTVNGRTVTELGTKANPDKDKIKVNGSLILTDVERLYLVFYKPKAVIAALKDPEGRPCIADYLRTVRERVLPVGQMDFNSEGLMLLTNDGDMLNNIVKARGLPKLYMVKVKGHPDEKTLSSLKDGIYSAEGVVRFADLQIEQALRNKSWLKLEVTEGARLDLRELLNRRGLLVDRIMRTAIGHLSIQGLEPGQLKFVKKADFAGLLKY